MHAATIVWRGQWPQRYWQDTLTEFKGTVNTLLGPGMRVVEIGARRHPSIAPSERPADCFYAALPPRGQGLHNPLPDAFDSVLTDTRALRGSFALALSYEGLSRARDPRRLVDAAHHLLVPGGRFVAYEPGVYAPGHWLLRTLPRPARDVVRRHFGKADDEGLVSGCTHSMLAETLSHWENVRITPRFLGGRHLRRWRFFRTAYIACEEWAVQSGRTDLASAYLVTAARPRT